MGGEEISDLSSVTEAEKSMEIFIPGNTGSLNRKMWGEEKSEWEEGGERNRGNKRTQH